MRRFLLVLCGILVYTGSLLAQDKEVKKRIENIKSQPEMIYVEMTADDATTAREKAEDALLKEVNNRLTHLNMLGEEGDDFQELRNKIGQTKVKLDYQSLSWTSWRKATVFAYISRTDAKMYTINKATYPIRNSRDYTFAEAKSPTEQEALGLARSNLITQFYVRVQSQQQSVIREENDEVDESFESQVRATSKMSLIGLKTQTFEVGENYYAVAYISDANKEESFSAAKNKILSVVEEGDRQWDWGNYSRAINAYYRAYILCDSYYKPINFTFKDGTETDDLKSTLRLKVEEYFQTADIDVRPAYEIGEEDIRAPFKMSKGDDLANRIIYQYRIQGYNQVDNLNYGKGKLEFTSYYPTERIEIFPVRFLVDISEELKSDPLLQELEPTRKFFVVRPIRVDFTNVFKVTIQAYLDGPEVTYSLEARNMVATTARWDFGDGESMVDLNPTHRYEDLNVKKVEVMVNGDPKLTDTKYVYLREGIVRNSPKKGDRLEDETKPAEPVATIPEPQADEAIKAADSTIEEMADAATVDSSTADSMVAAVQQTGDTGLIASRTDSVTMVIPDVESVPEPKQQKTYQDYLNETYDQLASYETFSGLAKTLQRLEKEGAIEFGNQSDLFDSEGAMVILANPESRRISDRLIFLNNRYIRIKTGEEMTNLTERYKGTRQIWVKIN